MATPNVPIFQPSMLSYPAQKSDKITPLLKAMKKEIFSDDKENIRPSYFNIQQRVKAEIHNHIAPCNSLRSTKNSQSISKPIRAYSLKGLVKIFRSMGNFSSQCLTNEKLSLPIIKLI